MELHRAMFSVILLVSGVLSTHRTTAAFEVGAEKATGESVSNDTGHVSATSIVDVDARAKRSAEDRTKSTQDEWITALRDGLEDDLEYLEKKFVVKEGRCATEGCGSKRGDQVARYGSGSISGGDAEGGGRYGRSSGRGVGGGQEWPFPLWQILEGAIAYGGELGGIVNDDNYLGEVFGEFRYYPMYRSGTAEGGEYGGGLGDDGRDDNNLEGGFVDGDGNIDATGSEGESGSGPEESSEHVGGLDGGRDDNYLTHGFWGGDGSIGESEHEDDTGLGGGTKYDTGSGRRGRIGGGSAGGAGYGGGLGGGDGYRRGSMAPFLIPAING